MTKRQRIKEIKHEIEWYGIRKPIANAMLELGEIGFEFSGHGCGMGGEDFGLVKYPKKNQPDCYFYVNFCDKGRSCEVQVTRDWMGVDETLFKGTIGKAINFVNKHVYPLTK